jgi:coatomer protein complex subunit gamma
MYVIAFVPFLGLEKGIVLQERRLFNENAVQPRKCSTLITKILYLLVQGDKFTKQEATDVFFAVTKLFQSKDVCCLLLLLCALFNTL